MHKKPRLRDETTGDALLSFDTIDDEIVRTIQSTGFNIFTLLSNERNFLQKLQKEGSQCSSFSISFIVLVINYPRTITFFGT